MASFNITSFSTTAQTLVTGETGFVYTYGALVTSGDAVTMSGNSRLVVDGTINSQIDGVVMQDGGNVVVSASGFITGRIFGIDIGGSDQRKSVVNAGTIIGDYDGIGWSSITHDANPFDFDLVNTGTIIGLGRAGVYSYARDGETATIRNFGTITGEAYGVRLSGGPDGSSRLMNAGEITAIGVGSEAVSGTSFVEWVINSGLIQAGDAGGDFLALDLSGGDDIVVNTGQIVGNVELGDGADAFRGTGGLVSGHVDGGAENDTLIGGAGDDDLRGGTADDLLAGHAGDDSLTGEAGNDTLFGGAGDDSLDGGTEADTLNAGDGNDTVLGGSGNDLILGQAGADDLEGGENSDTIDGGAGDDVIDGGDGNDILRGRAGEDQFKPGLGRDVMTGGEGADVFIFATTAIAGTGANRDVIQDFEQGTDIINVVAMAPGALDFIGKSIFSGTAAEIRVIETAAGTSIVEFDADGDGTADAQLKVTGVLGLTADDFAL